MCQLLATRKRSGSTVIETAVVLGVFLLLLFGVMEYCRLLFIRQLITNAAREGARYAVVNTYAPNVESEAIQRVNERMAGMQQHLSNYAVTIYGGDRDGNKIGTPADAAFGEYVVVEIECDYHPILPSFLMMAATIPVKFKAVMNSEAN